MESVRCFRHCLVSEVEPTRSSHSRRVIEFAGQTVDGKVRVLNDTGGSRRSFVRATAADELSLETGVMPSQKTYVLGVFLSSSFS